MKENSVVLIELIHYWVILTTIDRCYAGVVVGKRVDFKNIFVYNVAGKYLESDPDQGSIFLSICDLNEVQKPICYKYEDW